MTETDYFFEKTSGIICYFKQSDGNFVKTSADFFLLSKTFHIFAKNNDEPMYFQKKDYSEKRIIDFDPQICGLKDDSILVFSPLSLMEGNNLFLPEGIRMPNGEIIDNIIFEELSFSFTLGDWQKGPITLYAGRNYAICALNYFNWAMGFIRDNEKYDGLYYPNVNYICLYDDVYEFDGFEDYTVRVYSKNGILYCNDIVAFVPDCNLYAETLPLEPMHGYYKEDYCDLENFSLEGYGQDLYGGIYSLDGKRFLRYDGLKERTSYRLREGVEEIFDKAFWVVTGIGNGDHGLLLHTIELPKSLKRIGKEAFRASNIRKIELPDGITNIEEGTFLNCQALKSVILPKKIKTIGDSAFAGCGLKSIVIPKGVESIGHDCFNSFELSSIEVEEGNQYYSSQDGVLFNYDKTSLIRVPTTLYTDSPDNTNERKDIEQWHWEDYKCEKDGVIEYKNFYEGATYINKVDKETGKRYKEIIKRDDIFLHPSINLYGYYLSSGCRVYVEDGEHVKAGTLICTDKEWERRNDWRPFYGFTRKRYSIPDTVTKIEPRALDRCPIKELHIPKSVKSIGEKALIDNDFDIITISPENLFYETRNHCLIDKTEKAIICCFGNEKEIKIPEGVEKIKEFAFQSRETPFLVIPEGVTYIEDYAFWCVRTRRIVLPASICYLGSEAFRGMLDCAICEDWDDYLKISVPNGLKDKYMRMLDGSGFYERNFVEEKEMDNKTDEPDIELFSFSAKTSEGNKTSPFVDEYGVKYSKDGKLLFDFGENSDVCNYSVKEGTEIICDNAGTQTYGIIRLPSSMKYLGYNPISTCMLIIEGTDVNFAPNSLYLGNDDYIYIPCGTWVKYRSRLEKAKIRDEKDEEMADWMKEYYDYHLIELSKTNVIGNLREQQYILMGVIGQKNMLSTYEINSLNGRKGKDLICFRTSDRLLFFNEHSHCYQKYVNYLLALGYNLQKIKDLLSIQIDTIDVNPGSIESLIGYQLAYPVQKKWVEDFVNEDNGEVYSLDRSATFIEAGDNISAENVDLIKESRAQRIYVFHESYYNNYVDLVKLFIEAEEIEQKNSNSEQYEQETNMVYLDYMKELFPTQEPEDVSEDDKERLAYNIVIVIKGMIDHPGYLSDMILPIKFHASEVHQEMTDEEQNLQRLIGEFYDEMIKRVSDCQYDLEIMKVFKDIFEIQSDLEAYLENNGVSSPMIKLFLEDSFQYIRTSEGME